MIFKVEVSPAFENDVFAITQWYADISKDLATKFYTSLAQAMDYVAHYPNASAMRYGKIRCANIVNFPYSIHYSIDKSRCLIKVYGVLHSSRNPKLWKQISKRKL